MTAYDLLFLDKTTFLASAAKRYRWRETSITRIWRNLDSYVEMGSFVHHTLNHSATASICVDTT
jgi:hypothetical protein